MSWAGTIVDNRYEVKSVLGEGGMGVVLKARHKFTGAEVAVKLLHEHLRLRADLVGRFLTEAQAPASIKHPGIVKITDAGRLADGQPYLVMELLVGASLANLLEKRRVSFEEARRIGLGILEALGAAHAAGFVHRDLKPDNVFVEEPSGAVKLLDFGIAKVLAEIDVPLPGKKRSTAVSAMLGTLCYMSPEHLKSSKNVDARTDLWAVGVILYEMLAGRVPYEADDVAGMVVALYERSHAPLCAELGAPAALDAFFNRALAKDVAARFRSAAEMAAALRALPALGAAAGKKVEPDPDKESIETAPTDPSLPPERLATVVRTVEQRPIDLPKPLSTKIDTVLEPRPPVVVSAVNRPVVYVAGAGIVGLGVVAAVVLIGAQGKDKVVPVQPSATASAVVQTPMPTASASPRTGPDMAGWVRIEPGTFDMGSPPSEGGRYDNEAQHKVTISRAYWMKATEVTQAEWEAVMGANPSKFKACGGSCPVESVSWFEVVAYCNALSDKQGLERCYQDGGKAYDKESAAASKVPDWPKGLGCAGYRLPTEAEWEYAARAGSKEAFYTGGITQTELDCKADANLDKAGWYCGNAGSTTHPVKQKVANAWGLYDMLGNVWEWNWDWKENYAAGAQRDPVGPATGSYRVRRGGGWNNDAGIARAAIRYSIAPGDRYVSLGFRPVRSIP